MPFERGQSVLDGLRWIRVNKDPSLAIRFSCINANACKECMMELDGETVYACTARLEPREMTARAAVQQEAGARPRHRDRAARRTLCRKGEMMTIERKPVAFGDMRNWMKALKVGRRIARDRRRGRLERRARHHHAHGAGPGHRTGAAVQQHQGLQQERHPLRRGVRRRPRQLSPRRHDAGACRPTPIRANWSRSAAPSWKAASRRASSRKARARRTSSPARTSISTSSRCRSGTGSTAAAIC